MVKERHRVQVYTLSWTVLAVCSCGYKYFRFHNGRESRDTVKAWYRARRQIRKHGAKSKPRIRG
jgi:hypothetical protein